jgi:cytosine/adenosine deaminase-related metal-dependent hydrolase
LPGFISGHTHVAAGSPTRGLIESGRSYLRPLELVEELDDADLDTLTAWNLTELLRSGCTTQVEMSLSLRQAESYVRIARQYGARGFPGPMIPGIARLAAIWFRAEDDVLHRLAPGTLEEIEAAVAFARSTGSDRLIQPMLALHATDTHTPETLAAALAATKELGTGLHIHLAQSPGEGAATARLWGATPSAWLEHAGFGAGMPLFCAHLTGADLAAEPPVLRRVGATYATCPCAGGAAAQSQPWPELLAAGVNTCIGIDTHSNDYVEQIKLAVVKGRDRHDLLAPTSPVPLARPGIADAVAAATVCPATGLGRPDLGRIRAGACADLVAVDVSGPLVGSGAPPPEPLHNLLYANGLSVRHVITAGRLQLQHGDLLVDDLVKLRSRAAAVHEGIWRRLADEGWLAR